ncbi:MAG: hypothetical protein ACHQUC_01255 [Chlamydiales bacterium]
MQQILDNETKGICILNNKAGINALIDNAVFVTDEFLAKMGYEDLLKELTPKGESNESKASESPEN